jgi:hypothetical protein
VTKRQLHERARRLRRMVAEAISHMDATYAALDMAVAHGANPLGEEVSKLRNVALMYRDWRDIYQRALNACDTGLDAG